MGIWRRYARRQLARELEVLRDAMDEARSAGDIDWEYLLLCRIATKTEELNELTSP